MWLWVKVEGQVGERGCRAGSGVESGDGSSSLFDQDPILWVLAQRFRDRIDDDDFRQISVEHREIFHMMPVSPECVLYSSSRLGLPTRPDPAGPAHRCCCIAAVHIQQGARGRSLAFHKRRDGLLADGAEGAGQRAFTRW